MSSKRALKALLMDNPTFTYLDIKDIICSVKDLSGMSHINKELPREFLFNNIFKSWINELEDKNIDLNTIINTTRLNTNGRADRIVLSGNGVIVWNILRECKYQILKP
jgi:hypothetical protein